MALPSLRVVHVLDIWCCLGYAKKSFFLDSAPACAVDCCWFPSPSGWPHWPSVLQAVPATEMWGPIHWWLGWGDTSDSYVVSTFYRAPLVILLSGDCKVLTYISFLNYMGIILFIFSSIFESFIYTVHRKNCPQARASYTRGLTPHLKVFGNHYQSST